MKKIITMTTSRILLLTSVLSGALFQPVLHATPYASGITNNAGTIQFYLNESGGTVVVTYEDSSTNSTFTGFGAASTNLPSGQYGFSLGSHITYNIAVTKIGTGIGGLETNVIQSTNTSVGNTVLQGFGDPRGLDVNKNPASPCFGRIYVSRGGGNAGQQLLFDMNSDGSFSTAGNSGTAVGVTWSAAVPYSSPDRISIAADDYLVVGDFSDANSGVWRVDPNLGSAQQVLGDSGLLNGEANGVHGSEASRPLLVGDLATGANLMVVDGNFPSSQPNSILVYSNLTAAALPWLTAPNLVGPEVGINFAELDNYVFLFPSLCLANGYIYTGEYRGGVSSGDPAAVQVYSLTNYAQAWTSRYTNGTVKDYFYNSVSGGSSQNPTDLAVSPDGKFLATVSYDNHMTICSLTNGIPDVSTLYTIIPYNLNTPPAYSYGGNEIAWDAADNIYILSSGDYGLQVYTLGLSSTAITAGNSTGNTAFSFAFLNTIIGVYATNNGVISQANTHGNPTNGSFTLVRSGGNLGVPLTVNFTYSGTATNGTYTPGNVGSITLAAGQTTTNISIKAITDNLPRPTTYLTLTVTPSSSYSLIGSGAATMSILNTATPYLIPSVTAGAGSMYNAFSNDYASVTITRWGDTNTTVTLSSYTTAGSATNGLDYTAPTTVTFVPGDLTKVTVVHPLIAGSLPVHNPNLPFTGNKSIVLGVGSGSGYNPAPGTVTLTIVDSAHPPATVLFADPLSDPNDATNWGICAANGNMAFYSPVDTTIVFGQDLTAAQHNAIPFPPNGSQYALMETVNKNSTMGPGGGPATGLNAYLTNHVFGGNYAVRFNMNLVECGNLYENNLSDEYYDSEEGVLFGINHNGTETNWFYPGTDTVGGTGLAGGPWAGDGVFCWVSDSGGSYLDTWPNYELYTGNGSPTTNGGFAIIQSQSKTSFVSAFKTNVFTTPISTFVPPFDSGWTEGGPGLPANGSPQYGLSAASWADVEIKQLNGIVTVSIDKTPIFVYTNTSIFTNGSLMLGYEDAWDGTEDTDAAVYYSNLQVVSIGAPTITNMGVDNVHGNVVMDFSVSDDSGMFTIQGSSSVNGPFANASATITPLGNGAFEVIVPQNGAKQFYRILQQ